jgi:hypothetical protein
MPYNRVNIYRYWEDRDRIYSRMCPCMIMLATGTNQGPSRLHLAYSFTLKMEAVCSSTRLRSVTSKDVIVNFRSGNMNGVSNYRE